MILCINSSFTRILEYSQVAAHCCHSMLSLVHLFLISTQPDKRSQNSKLKRRILPNALFDVLKTSHNRQYSWMNYSFIINYKMIRRSAIGKADL